VAGLPFTKSRKVYSWLAIGLKHFVDVKLAMLYGKYTS
jgi:hypothetical protein